MVVMVGLASASISLLRLWLANPDSIATVMWAEDGLFPLCVRKSGFLGCLIDPFAGYSIFLPRVMAGVTSLFPIDAWPIAANVIAGVLGGVIAGWAFWWLRRAGLGSFVAVAVALLPVLTPIVGFESISVVASIYMPLLFLAAIMVAFPIDPYPTKSVAAFMLLTALTIPSAGLLVVVILLQGLTRSIRWRSIIPVFLAIVIGILVQVFFAATAARPREVSPGLDSLSEWANAVPAALLTFWPGLNLGPTALFGNFDLIPWAWTGALVVGVLTVGGVWLVVRRPGRPRAVGYLILTGVALGAFPSVIGYSSNRYFVTPCMLWAAALLVALDPRIRRTAPAMLAVCTALVLVIWWPAIPASPWRTTPAPNWQGEVERLVVHCTSDPGIKERFVFSPYWPPNWGDGLSEPSHPDVSCLQARKWA